jgi:hypothetical protein
MVEKKKIGKWSQSFLLRKLDQENDEAGPQLFPGRLTIGNLEPTEGVKRSRPKPCIIERHLESDQRLLPRLLLHTVESRPHYRGNSSPGFES